MNLAVQNARQRSALSERERQLTAALAHKDMLVGELHHRVKNNLQTIVALLDLRARQTDSGTAEELRDLAARMRALARVQARIYETQSLDRVDFTATLAEMVVELVKVYGEDRIKPALSLADPVRLEVGRAMPLALLCYEVLLNALKHAWPGGRDGMLSVQMKRSGEAVELRIVDDGVGFESGQVNKGFGSRLTPALAREADSDLSIESRPGSGTTVTIRLA
jgi:two-component sensor histidine kinase